MLTRADLSHGLFTRRHATRILVATLGAAAAGSFTQAQTSEQPKEEAPCTSANQARTAIHYDLDFKASPQHFYETLLTSKQFAVFSGMPATIDATEGGAFSMFGGLIVGRNVELVPNQRIVQAWRPSHWDAGLYSIVRFEFKPSRLGLEESLLGAAEEVLRIGLAGTCLVHHCDTHGSSQSEFTRSIRSCAILALFDNP
jgi:activator of HSP90 ATPase